MFYQSFVVIILLVVLVTVISIFYAIAMIIKKIYKAGKFEKAQQEILKAADSIFIYQEQNNIKNIVNIEDLYKHIKIPKKMKLIKENDELFIKYFNLTYNLNKGRYLE